MPIIKCNTKEMDEFLKTCGINSDADEAKSLEEIFGLKIRNSILGNLQEIFILVDNSENVPRVEALKDAVSGEDASWL
ncbi:MAG: hypothetical protein U9R14_02305 [Patescibacteria group bacterium]|nr:hypothetical protein [Patescibacteria group bacterium]